MIGELYLVATPIGDMTDIAPRALGILSTVDIVAVEDKRRSSRLFSHFGIKTPMISYHDHGEEKQIKKSAIFLICLFSAQAPLGRETVFKLDHLFRRQKTGVHALKHKE